MSHPMLCSIIIPAYNEEENLPLTLPPLIERLDNESIPFELVVVNDNSTDGTQAFLESFRESEPRLRICPRCPPGGFGRAIRSGLEAATGDAIIIYMADCSDHPEDAVAYYRKLEEGYDCVYGSRFLRGGRCEHYPWGKLIVNRIVNRVIQFLFWCPFNDLTNAFKAYRSHVIDECGPFHASHFNITIEM